MTVPSYNSPLRLGHRHVREIFLDDVVVQEKVDGSQFSFCLGSDGEVECRSKGADMNINEPDGMFKAAVAAVMAAKHLMKPGLIYRGEYLQRPRHNCLAYDRVPKNHVMLFDIEEQASGLHFQPAALEMEADCLGFEAVPVLFRGQATPETVQALMDTVSVLGGPKIEGVVVKNYTRRNSEGQVLRAKFVSEAFKEVHTGRVSKPKEDPVAAITADYSSTARWQKAVQHLREAGALAESPRDIGPLIKEVGDDIMKEESEAIKQALFDAFWPQIRRGVVTGLPEWYKDQLARSLVDSTDDEPQPPTETADATA